MTKSAERSTEVVLAETHDERGPFVRDRLTELAQDARRVLLVARSSTPLDPNAPRLPEDAEPLALVIIAEVLRPVTTENGGAYAREGVRVKIFSGVDDPRYQIIYRWIAEGYINDPP